MRMRKGILAITILGIALILGGCRKKEEQRELLPISHEKFVYEGTQGAHRIAVDTDGVLYTVSSVLPEDKGPVLASEAVIPQAKHTVSVYDTDGNCVKQIEFELGSGTVSVLMEHGGKLYFVLYCSTLKAANHRLFRLDIATEEVTELAVLEGYSSISDMVWVGDSIYMLGQYRNAESKDYTLYPDVLYYTYNKEMICRFCPDKENAKVELMNVDFPVDIYETAEDTLVIYCYTEEKGFAFLEFNPAEGTLVEAGQKSTAVAIDILSGCEEGYLFGSEKLYYGTVDGTYAQVSPDDYEEMNCTEYTKGFVYSLRGGGGVERICIADVLQENTTIQVLLTDFTPDEPYGCGFCMTSTTLPAEQFSLKILALDTDYDLCLLSTRDQCAYNLKENGVFYTLNEVEGVQEYLDACFPYLKELAYDEDGDIWMLPVQLAIPVLIYNRDYCRENGVDIVGMDYMEFLTFTEEVKKTDPEKTSLSFYIAAEEVFAKYLEQYDSFDTELFRSYAKKLYEIRQNQGEWRLDFYVNSELVAGRVPEIYYEYNVYSDTLNRYAKWLSDSDTIGLMSVPKISEQNGNVGTLTFLAVNPHSENLKATLAYVSAYAKYMLTVRDSFLLADQSTYTNTPFVRDWYEVYAGGSVRFAMDTEVYLETFNEYILGNIDLEVAITEMERRRKLYLEE